MIVSDVVKVQNDFLALNVLFFLDLKTGIKKSCFAEIWKSNSVKHIIWIWIVKWNCYIVFLLFFSGCMCKEERPWRICLPWLYRCLAWELQSYGWQEEPGAGCYQLCGVWFLCKLCWRKSTGGMCQWSPVCPARGYDNPVWTGTQSSWGILCSWRLCLIISSVSCVWK